MVEPSLDCTQETKRPVEELKSFPEETAGNPALIESDLEAGNTERESAEDKANVAQLL